MDSAVKMPLSQRINFRIILFGAVVLLLLGTPIYWFIRETVTGGIVDRGDYKEVDLKSLGNFPFNEEDGKMSDVPPKIRELDGQKVLLEGEMYSPLSAHGEIREFTLVYNIQMCCFNGPPKVQERVFAKVAKGKGVEYASGINRVMGTLHIKDARDESGKKIVSLFTMDVDSVVPR